MMHQSSQPASIIIVADTLFYPPRRNGFSVRYYPLVVELTKRGYQVDVIVINRYKESYTSTDIEKLKCLCREIDIIETATPRESRLKRLVRRIGNFSHKFSPSGTPYHLIDSNRDYYQHCIHAILGGRETYDFGIGVGVGGDNADILLSLAQDVKPRKVICDFVDSAYLLLKRSYNGMKRTPSPLEKLELNKTRRWEKSFCERCTCVYISEEDAQTVGNSSAHVIPNCVVEDGFDQSRVINLESPNIAFVGNMSYPPNITACTFLLSELLPAIRNRIPDIHLYIIGRHPGKELLAQDTSPNIHITGEVENIWDYIRAADVFVFPMQTGAGLQNKVLEAMYAGKPVVTSSIGNEGIGAEHGRDIFIAGEIAEYVNYVKDAIYHGDRISNNAKSFVQRHYSSHSQSSSFIKLLSCDKPIT